MNKFLVASALLLCVACAREEFRTDDRIVGGKDNASEMIFSAVSPSTKTMMGESVEGKRPVYWSEGDKICVNGVVSDPLEGVSENATAAVFRVGSGLDAPFKGLYPASFYTDASTITLPSVQTWESGSFANGSFPMASYTLDQNEEMAFRFLCSIIKLSIKQDTSQGADTDEIASVVFSGNDGEQVSGAFTIDYENATLSSTSSSDNDKIVGVMINQALSADNALDVYVVVPANVYSSGFSFVITDTQGHVMKKVSNKSQTLKAGIISVLPEFVFVPNAEGGDTPVPEDLIPQEGDVTEDGEPVVMYFGARIDNGEGDDEGTKTHLGTPSEGKYPNLWMVGDKVAINGIASASLPEVNITGGGKKARFPMAQVVDKSGGYYYVGYPYLDGSTAGFTGFSSVSGSGTVVVPSEQTYIAGTYDPRAFVMVGKSTTQEMIFTPLMAMFRITPRDESTPTGKKVRSVTLTAIGDEAMSGTFTTNFTSSLTEGSGNSSVTITVADASGVDFGNPFFFMIPARTYAKGFRVTITTTDGKSMSFSNTASYTATVGNARGLTAPAFVESKVGEDLACVFKTSSSAAFQWSGSNASNNIKKPWRLAIYTDSDCTSLQVAYNIPADSGAEGVWKDQSGTPRFIVGGLERGTDYWCTVTDVNNAVSSEPLKFTTDAFAPNDDVLLAEDFGEFGHGSAFLGGYAGTRFGGWSPRATNPGNNSINCAAPTGEVTGGVYLSYENLLRVVDGFNFTTAPRFYNAGWGFTADALDAEGGDETFPSVYAQPGAMLFGKKNSHRIFLVLPALSGIPSGKFATVDVIVKASHVVKNDVDNNKQLAVFLENDLSMTNTPRRLYGTPSLTRAYPFDVNVYGPDSDEYTIRIHGVQCSDHLIIGAYNNIPELNRFQIYSVVVKRVSESDVELFDITDDVSLRTWYARVTNGDETTLRGNVCQNFSVLSSTAADWEPIDGYTGTLEGNNHTISGLTKPFFADLQGTVQNLTLNSNIEQESASVACIGIFAQRLNGLSGTMTDCVSKGSLTYQPDDAVTEGVVRRIGGMVGEVKSGSMTRCSNYASISVPHNDENNDMILEVGGVIGRLDNTTSAPISSYLHNVHDSDVTNSGKISVSIIHAKNTSYECRVGGVIGYVSSDASAISNCTNSGAVEYAGTSYGALKMGGIVGYSRESVSDCQNTGSVTITDDATVTQGYLALGGLVGFLDQPYGSLSGGFNSGDVTNEGANTDPAADINVGGLVGRSNRAISSTYNTALVENAGNAAKNICLGGVVGYAEINADMTDCSNGTSTVMGGMISNSGSAADICMGGVAGYNNGKTLTRCFNKGQVTNSGDGSGVAALGGLVGWSSDGSVYAPVCYNTGKISNTGTCSSTMAVRLGGLVASAKGSSTLTSTSSSKNYNNGPIEEASASATGAIGGICGYSYDNVSGFNYCENQANGDIDVKNTTKSELYIGGVVGQSVKSSTIDYTSNSGDIQFTSVNVSTKTGVVYVGGVIGAYTENNEQTITQCKNYGTIRTATTTGTICTDLAIPDASVYNPDNTICCFGGIVGGNNDMAKKTYTNCVNEGDIKLWTQVKLRVGGIAGYLGRNPSGCTAHCDIRVYKTDGLKAQTGNVGGIAGYMNIAAVSNIEYVGTLITNASTPAHFCGGLIGRVKDANVTFTNCRVGGQVYGAKTVHENAPGLFCTIGTTENKLENISDKLRSLTFTFKDCVVQTGTIFNSSTTITTLSRDYLIGGPHNNVTVGTINTAETVIVGSLD